MKNFQALKWLCILSFIGFLYCFVTDLGFCLAFYDASGIFEKTEGSLRDIIENWTEKGIIYNEILKNIRTTPVTAKISKAILMA